MLPKGNAPKDDSTSAAPQGGSLLKAWLPAVLGGLLALIGCGLLIQFSLTQQSDAHFTRIVDSQVNEVRAELGAMLNTLSTSVTTVAQDPRLGLALASQNPALVRDLETLSRQMLTHSTVVSLTPLGEGRRDANTRPPISFAQLEMMSLAERGESPAPEIHKTAEGTFVSLAAAIRHQGTIVGTLFVAFDFTRLSQTLPDLPPDIGYLEWQQEFPGNPPLILLALGDKALAQGLPMQAKWSVSHWNLLAWPVSDSSTAISASLWLIIAGGVLVTVVAAIIGLRLVQTRVDRNAERLAQHFQAMTSHDKAPGGYDLAVFARLAQQIDRIFHEHDALLRQRMTSLRPPSPPIAAARPAALDSLDIDMSEPDDFFSARSTPPKAVAPPPLLSPEPVKPASPVMATPAPAAPPAVSRAATDDGLDDLDALDLDFDLDVAPAATPAASSPVQPSSPGLDISDGIFRAYDIRGVVGDTLTPDIARLIGLAVGAQAMEQGQEGVIVARDGRISSESLQQALMDGLVQSGQRVIDIGRVPTPVLYFATHTLATQSGVMVTGSHNPPEFNGFKIVIAGVALHGEAIQSLLARIRDQRYKQFQGSYEKYDILAEYRDRIVRDVVLARPMRVVVDCGNGVGGVIFPQLMDRLGCTVTSLFEEVDGRFPNHHPDPSEPHNLEALINAVREKKADIGLALDGDGDRLGVVTRNGDIIWPDRLLMLFAQDLLSRNPGGDIVYDVKCTRDLADLVSHLGGRALMNATGHSLMKARMKETGALVGGELSGHLFFNDRWFGFDDAMYAAARLLEILSMESDTPEAVFARYPLRASTPELKIPVSDTRKFTVMAQLAAQGQFKGGSVVNIDGVRVDYPDGWGLIRASNTTPNLVARFEGDDADALESIIERFQSELMRVEPGLIIPT